MNHPAIYQSLGSILGFFLGIFFRLFFGKDLGYYSFDFFGILITSIEFSILGFQVGNIFYAIKVINIARKK